MNSTQQIAIKISLDIMADTIQFMATQEGVTLETVYDLLDSGDSNTWCRLRALMAVAAEEVRVAA